MSPFPLAADGNDIAATFTNEEGPVVPPEGDGWYLLDASPNIHGVWYTWYRPRPIRPKTDTMPSPSRGDEMPETLR